MTFKKPSGAKAKIFKATEVVAIFENDPRYSKLLLEIVGRPAVLYARGNIALLDSLCFAVVGTRGYTPYGKANAIYFTRGLLSYGLTIVSGLAYGIDAVVHETVLECKGRTIAVLGNGIDDIYPAQHEALAQDILKKGGLILSEYEPGTPSFKHHFPARNRIISGLSLGTLVIEAPEKSGALITARRAFEQNREVFALPGDLTRVTTVGNLNLIAGDIARLVRSPEDIVAHLREQPDLDPTWRKALAEQRKKGMTPQLETSAQRKIWAALKQGPLSYDDLLDRTSLGVVELSVALTYLEFYRFVRAVGYQRFARTA